MDVLERYCLLRRARHNPYLQQLLLEASRRDIVFWFNTFCWTFDPRCPQPNLPFCLYPFQAWFVRELEDRIDQQQDWGVEKSRDMGVSWMVMLVLQHGWLFKSGWNLHIGSRKEAEVDTTIADPSTLFGKFRYNLKRLPAWMRPPVRDKKLSIQNLSNHNLLTGESANPSFGRGHRQRCIFLDELAFWDAADSAYGSASETTRCRGVTSTPYGDNNRFAQLMMDSRNICPTWEPPTLDV
jgi:phage terminase large subunit